MFYVEQFSIIVTNKQKINKKIIYCGTNPFKIKQIIYLAYINNNTIVDNFILLFYNIKIYQLFFGVKTSPKRDTLSIIISKPTTYQNLSTYFFRKYLHITN